MKKLIAISLLAFVISGCVVAKTGEITHRTSEFDGKTTVEMSRVFLDLAAGRSVFFTLRWSDATNSNLYVLEMFIEGANNFSDAESLTFNVDGTFHPLKSGSTTTNIAPIYIGTKPVNFSSKRYVITRKLLEEIINSEKTTYRVNYFTDYVEGRFDNSYSNPFEKMQGFLDAIDEYTK